MVAAAAAEGAARGASFGEELELLLALLPHEAVVDRHALAGSMSDKDLSPPCAVLPKSPPAEQPDSGEGRGALRG